MKIWAYLAILVAVISAMGIYSKNRYNAGWTAAVAEQQTHVLKDMQDAVDKAKIEWEIASEESKVLVVIEEKIVEKTIFVDREIPRIVETIKYECRNLGTAFVSLYNESIGASSGHEDEASTTTAELNPSM